MFLTNYNYGTMFITLLFFIFARPFIASLAFPYLDAIYSIFFIGVLISFFFVNKVSFEKIKGLKYPLILFCFALFISLIFSSNRINSFKELYKYISGLLLFTIASSMTYKQAERAVKVIILSGCAVSLLAVYQYFVGFQNLLPYLDKIEYPTFVMKNYILHKRVFFPFVTPNTLAGYLIMIISLALPFKNNIWFISLFFITLIFTKSLGAIVSILLVLGLYFYLCEEVTKRKIIFLLGLYISVIFIFFLRVKFQGYGQPLTSILNRLQYWQSTWALIKFSPLFGVGLGNFDIPVCRYAHNTYLQIWAEMGILGIISWLWLVILAIVKGISINRRYMAERVTYQPQDISVDMEQNRFFNGVKILGYPDYMFPGLISAIVVFLIHNIIDFSFFLPEVSLIWWFILGLIFAEKKHPIDEDTL